MVDHQSAAFSSQRFWGTIGGCVILLAVGLGAFGAHLLSEKVLPNVHRQEPAEEVSGLSVPASYKAYLDYKTAVHYQMIHGIGIILVGLLGRRGKARQFGYLAGGCFLAGIVLFCGSLYLMTVAGVQSLHWFVPLGGVFFLLGWGCFITAAFMPRTRDAWGRKGQIASQFAKADTGFKQDPVQ